MTVKTFAYADPPYPGKAKKHYDGTEVDHAALIQQLVRDYPDGWALPTNSTALHKLLPLCPPDVRVLAWVKTWSTWKKGVYPAYAWEPVLMCGGRRFGPEGTRPMIRDWISCNAPMGKKSKIIGQKPEAFCLWLFDCLGAELGDQLVDLFPGSGAVTDAWKAYCQRQSLSS